MNRRAARRARFGLVTESEPAPMTSPVIEHHATEQEEEEPEEAAVPPLDQLNLQPIREIPDEPQAAPVQQQRANRFLLSTFRDEARQMDANPSVEDNYKIIEGAVEDQYFLESVKLLLRDARSDLRAPNFDPIGDVAELLGGQRGVRQQDTPADRELRLAEFRDMREDADRLLNEYIAEHYDQFSSSIQHFSSMILSVSASYDTISLLKRNIALATSGMTTHAVELAQLRRRGLRNVFVKNLLHEVRECIGLQREIAGLVQSKHYLAAAQKVKRLEQIISKSSLGSIKALSPVAEFVASAPAAHARLIAKDLLHCVYRVDKLRDLSERLFGRLASANGKVPRKNRAVGSDSLQVLLSESESTAELHPERDFNTFIPKCVAALRLLGKLDDARNEFLSQCFRLIEKYICSFLRVYVGWYKTQLFRGLANPGATVALSQWEATARRFDRTVEAKLCDDQKEMLGGLLSSLFKEMYKILRNANFLTNVVAAVQFPFLGILLEEPALRYRPEMWSMERMPTVSCISDVRGVLTAAKNASSAALAASGGGQGTDVVLSLLWKSFDVDSVIRKSAAFPVHSTLKAFLSRIDACAVAVVEQHPTTCNPEVAHICCTSLKNFVAKEIQNAIRAEVDTLLASWDSVAVWNHMNHLLEETLHPLCSDMTPDSVRDTRTLRYKAQAPLYVAPVVRKFPTLGQMLSSKSSASGPRFLDEVGGVYFSLSALQMEKQRDGRERSTEISRRLRFDVAPTHDAGADSIPEAWELFRPYLVHGVFNTPVCIIASAEFVRSCRDLLPQLSSGRPCFSVMQPLASEFAPRYVVSLRHLLQEQLSVFFKSTWQRVSTRFHGSTPHPVLASCHFVDSAVEDIICSARRLEAYSIAEIDQLSGQSPSELLLQLSEELVEEIAFLMKKQIESLVEGTPAHEYLGPLFDAAFSHAPLSEWKMLRNEDNIYGAHVGIDHALLQLYQKHNLLRMRGQYTVSAPTSTTPAESTVNWTALPVTSITELALISHSLEWLVDHAVMHHWPHFAPMQPRCCIPGSLFNEAVISHAGEPMSARLVDLLQRLLSVSQAALFYLCFEVRCAAFRTLSQLRDESYSLVAARLHPDAFVEEYQRTITRAFATVAPFLSEKKRKYLMLTLGRPIADIMINELSHLRDKIITTAGVEQLKLDVLAMQDCIHAQLPLDAEVRSATIEFMSRARLYFNLLRNTNCVEELLADDRYKKYSVTEMENLVSLVFRTNSDGLLEQIHLLRQRLASVSSAEEARQAEITEAERTPRLAAAATTTPPSSEIHSFTLESSESAE